MNFNVTEVFLPRHLWCVGLRMYEILYKRLRLTSCSSITKEDFLKEKHAASTYLMNIQCDEVTSIDRVIHFCRCSLHWKGNSLIVDKAESAVKEETWDGNERHCSITLGMETMGWKEPYLTTTAAVASFRLHHQHKWSPQRLFRWTGLYLRCQPLWDAFSYAWLSARNCQSIQCLHRITVTKDWDDEDAIWLKKRTSEKSECET